jgi:very-short-patch-repair endonuclease
MRQRFPTKMTKIERALYEAFTIAGFSFEMHRTMFARWQPDFVFDEAALIVQADGEYWHSLPRAAANDRLFDATATDAGWTVIRFGGKQIKRDVSSCVEIVRSFLAESGDREICEFSVDV